MPMSEHAQLGDRVTVSMPSSSVALAALLGYLLPPVSLLAGAVVAANVYKSDVAAVLGAGLGFVFGLLLARLIFRFAFGRSTMPAVCEFTSRNNFQPGEHR